MVLLLVVGLVLFLVFASLFGSSFDIDLALTNALTLLALAGSLFLTLLAALLLRFLLRTSALVDAVQVYLAQNIQLGSILCSFQVTGSFCQLHSLSLFRVGRFFCWGLLLLWLNVLCGGRLCCCHLGLCCCHLGLWCCHFGLCLCYFRLWCLWLGSFHRCRLWFSLRLLLGLWLRLLLGLWLRLLLGLGLSLGLANAVQVNLAHSLELRTMLQQLVCRSDSLFLLLGLFCLFLLHLFGEQLFSLGLDSLVRVELVDQSLVLSV